MSIFARFWPWSQIEWWKGEVGGLANQLQASAHTERQLHERLFLMTQKASKLQADNIRLMTQNTNLAFEMIQAQTRLDNAEQKLGELTEENAELKKFIAGTEPSEVLYPPELKAASDALGELVGLPENNTEPQAAWPFPTSPRP